MIQLPTLSGFQTRDVRKVGRARCHPRCLREVRGQSPDVLQPPVEVSRRRDRGTAAEAAWAQGASQAHRGGVGLGEPAPGQRGDAVHVGIAGGDSEPLWCRLAPTHDREAREGPSRKKKRRRLTPYAAPSLGVEADRARERYERLRDQYLHGSGDEAGPPGERFARLGLDGLFDSDPPRGYVAQIHEARARGWGGVDPCDAALREVMRLVLGSGLRGSLEDLDR